MVIDEVIRHPQADLFNDCVANHRLEKRTALLQAHLRRFIAPILDNLTIEGLHHDRQVTLGPDRSEEVARQTVLLYDFMVYTYRHAPQQGEVVHAMRSTEVPLNKE